jgi:hypothetical protein
MATTNDDVWWYLAQFLNDGDFGNMLLAFPCLRAFILPRVDLSRRRLEWMVRAQGAAKYLLINRTFSPDPRAIAWLPVCAIKSLIDDKKITVTPSLVTRGLLCGRKEVTRFFFDHYTSVHRDYTASGGSEEYWEDIVEHPSMVVRSSIEDYLRSAARENDVELLEMLIEFIPTPCLIDGRCRTTRKIAYQRYGKEGRKITISLTFGSEASALFGSNEV